MPIRRSRRLASNNMDNNENTEEAGTNNNSNQSRVGDIVAYQEGEGTQTNQVILPISETQSNVVDRTNTDRDTPTLEPTLEENIITQQTTNVTLAEI